MEETCEITRSGKAVGRARVRREGLYYCFSCRCAGSGIFRIRVSRGGKEENLGIPLPENGGFVLETRLPVSRFPAGKFRFFVEEQRREYFVPVVPGQPFDRLEQLKNARYAERDGIAGVMISEIQDDAHGAVI